MRYFYYCLISDIISYFCLICSIFLHFNGISDEEAGSRIQNEFPAWFKAYVSTLFTCHIIILFLYN